MSVEQSFSQADLRSTAQDFKRTRDAAHKWALGANNTEIAGRAAGKPRPHRPSETEYNLKRREAKSAVASLAHDTKVARKHDMLEGTDDSSGSDDYDETPSPPPDVNITYSFDAARGPTKGSQILNVALNKAMQKWEEAETTKLVRSEYELLDADGEVVAATPDKKRKSKAKNIDAAVTIADDEDYEFV